MTDHDIHLYQFAWEAVRMHREHQAACESPTGDVQLDLQTYLKRKLPSNVEMKLVIHTNQFEFQIKEPGTTATIFIPREGK